MTLTLDNLKAANEKEFEYGDVSFRIRKLTTKEILNIHGMDDDNKEAVVTKIMALSLVSPAVTEEDVSSLPFDFCQAVTQAYREHNGLTDDKKKLSGIDSTSSV